MEEKSMYSPVTLLAQTDSYAFEELMHAHLPGVYRLCCWLVKDPVAAEDLTQEVFLQAYRHLGSFRGESQLGTWLYRIAVNESKRYLRSWSVRKLLYFSPSHTTFETASGPALSDEENGPALKELERLVHSLPFRHKQMIVLYYYEDMSAERIAEILDMKVGAVYTRLHRAREALKKKAMEEGTEWIWTND